MTDKISLFRLQNAITYGRGLNEYVTKKRAADKVIGNRHIDEFLKASKDKRVLDVGCGPATWSIVAALYGAASVDGFDLEPEMVHFGKVKAAENGVSHCVDLQVGDVSNMNYPSQSKDRLISVLVGCNLPTHDDIYLKHFQEIARVMADDGEALIVAPTSMDVLFTRDGTDALEVRAKIKKIVTGLGNHPPAEAIADAFNDLSEVKTATFANDEDGKLFLVTDVTQLREGQLIWRKLPKLTLQNYFHSDGSYQKEIQRAGLKITRVIRDSFSSEKERKEYNESTGEDVGPEYVNNAHIAFYYITKLC